MTEHTPKTRSQFQRLKMAVFDSMADLYDQEQAAAIAGDIDTADSFMTARVTLREELMELRHAEIAFECSVKPVHSQIQHLEAAVAAAKTGRAQIKTGPQALRGASRVINLLKTLPPMLS